jgi:TonB-dependent starch-binding outer membrane protein SusC
MAHKRSVGGRLTWLLVAAIGTALAIANPVQGQGTGRRLTGHVFDAEGGASIPAVTVLVNGTTIGMQTSDSGTFAFNVPDGPVTLTVRRVGYQPQTVTVTASARDVTVRMSRDVLHLEQEVITGVATSVSSKNSANAVAVVGDSAINRVPATTIEDALQGKVPSAIIQQNNGGAPGGSMQVQIRGVTSIFANAFPLYVIDGVLVNNETVNSGLNTISQAAGGVGPDEQDMSPNRIADLNPQDIESIEVLKGASASAIYGSKASAGVIVITTKKGTGGRPVWNFTQLVGQFSILNTYGLRTFPTLASAQAWGNNYNVSQSLINSVYGGPQNYQQQLFGQNQASYETDLSVAGTSGHTQYFLSGLFKYDNGTLLNTGYNKQTARANVTQTLSDNLSATINLNFAHSLTRRSLTGNDNIGASPYTVFSYTPQFVALDRRNPDGSWPINPFGPANPFADALEMQTPEEVSRVIAGGTISWIPWKAQHQSLQVTFIGGADYAYQSDLFYAPPDLQVEQEVPSGLPGVSQANYARTTFLNASVNLVHHYTGFSFMDMTTSVGFQSEQRGTNNSTSAGQDLLADVNQPTAGAVQTVVNNAYLTYDQMFYAQEQLLMLDQRLALTAGVTAERTTNDGDINKFYPFPKFSGSYVVPKFVNFVDELKVRAAYGQSGTQPLYGVKFTPYNPASTGGLIGVYPNLELGDANIEPEHDAETELGFDATMLKSRAQFSFTVYQKHISNMLLQANVSPSLGYNEEWLNGGAFTNSGIELAVTATPVQTRAFQWLSTTSFYRNYSVVNSLPVPAFVLQNGGGGNLGTFQVQVGRSISQILGQNIDANGNPINPVQVGDAFPSFVMNFDNTFTYDRFAFAFLVVWSQGGGVGNFTDVEMDGSQGLLADSALSAKRIAVSGYLTPYFEPASFVKVREMSLSYALPVQLFSGWASGIRSASLSLVGRNLFMWTPYTGLDPEVNFVGNTQVQRGQDVTPYPPSRSWFFGIHLGF